MTLSYARIYFALGSLGPRLVIYKGGENWITSRWHGVETAEGRTEKGRFSARTAVSRWTRERLVLPTLLTHACPLRRLPLWVRGPLWPLRAPLLRRRAPRASLPTPATDAAWRQCGSAAQNAASPRRPASRSASTAARASCPAAATQFPVCQRPRCPLRQHRPRRPQRLSQLWVQDRRQQLLLRSHRSPRRAAAASCATPASLAQAAHSLPSTYRHRHRLPSRPALSATTASAASCADAWCSCGATARTARRSP